MKPLLFTTGLLLFLLPARTAQGQSLSCPTAAADTSEWTHYDEGDFSFKLPSRFEEVRFRSVDSQVGKWEAGDAHIYYDLGAYSNPLDPSEQGTFPGLVVCQKGKSWDIPRIVVYRDEDTRTPRMGAYWTDFPREDFATALTLAGSVTGDHGFPEMLAVIQSVEFSDEFIKWDE